jgi:hypothetical protein
MSRGAHHIGIFNEGTEGINGDRVLYICPQEHCSDRSKPFVLDRAVEIERNAQQRS